ncbi:putative niacin/nicotinamide transporter NaiP [Pseudovibrio axinellae]|uniref:Putative niacin/nicotinamide transporter NaiP n=2 Tax=Pseudovibrio axinellae TaxID=989403 RepID=A0A165VM90_9HYPH|nr:putative niacin/nicotinamide transporter NaiP [Pseudovibrio axinellae]SER85737.1 Predicted arabinose efflux permease, MFS family [Pseudovibrio axinellae]
MLLAFMVTGVSVVGQLYLTIPLNAPLSVMFAVRQESAAWAGSAFGFAYATGFLVFGPVSDRYGRRRVILSGLACLFVATAMLYFAESLPQFLALRVMQGFAAASFPPVALSVIAETLPIQRRAQGVAFMSFSFLAAAPLAQMVGASVTIAPTQLMLSLSPIYLVCALCLALTIPGTRHPQSSVDAPKNESGLLKGLFSTPKIVSSWCAALTVLFGFISFQIGLSLLAQTKGVDAELIKLVGLPALLLSLASGKLSQRFTPEKLALVGLTTTAVGLFLTLAGTPVLLIASLIISAGIAMAVPGLITVIASNAQQTNRGLAMSLYTFCLFIGASVAPPTAIALNTLSFAALISVPAILLLLAAFFISLVSLQDRRQQAILTSK